MFADLHSFPALPAADLKARGTPDTSGRVSKFLHFAFLCLTLSAMLRPTVTGGAAVSYFIPRGHHVGSEMDLISRGCGLDKHSVGPRQGHHMENVLQPTLSLPLYPFICALFTLQTFCFPTCQPAASVGPSYLSSPIWPQSGSSGGRQVRLTRQEERTNGKESEDDVGVGGGGVSWMVGNAAGLEQLKKKKTGVIVGD